MFGFERKLHVGKSGEWTEKSCKTRGETENPPPVTFPLPTSEKRTYFLSLGLNLKNTTTAGLFQQGGAAGTNRPPAHNSASSGAPRFAGVNQALQGGASSSNQPRRWIPPSALNRHDAQSRNEDSVFRRVRGILNKLTPEKFEKLTLDIINVGLDTPTILKGVILLIFEKALDEPKYSSMYAQLCRRLADNTPNFEEVGSKTGTFKRLLLNKCRIEFENRTQIAQEYENVSATSSSDEQLDAKFLAKRKMLGNIKFIGELGKLQIVHNSILHKCCEQLLVGRKKQPVSDQVEDLECLCHLMRTCGRILDTQIAKSLMDQYFERLKQAVDNEALPLRIRFMIQDILELRRNKWMPRKLGKTPEGPRTIQQVREDAYRDGCIYMPQQSSPPNSSKSGMNFMASVMLNPLEGSFFDTKSKSGTGSSALGEVFGSGYFGTGPGTIQSEHFEESPTRISHHDNQPSPPLDSKMTNGFNYGGLANSPIRPKPTESDKVQNIQTSKKPNQPRQEQNCTSASDNLHRYNHNRNQHPQHQQNREKLPDFGDQYSTNRSKERERRHQHQFNHKGSDRYNKNNGYQGRQGGYVQHNNHQNKMNNDDHHRQSGGNLPPRFKKVSHSGPNLSSSHSSNFLNPSNSNHTKEVEVNFRPQVMNSMLFKPKTPSMLPKSAISRTSDGTSPLGENSLLGPPLPSTASKVMMQQNEPMVIKQAPLDKNKRDKSKGNKGPTIGEVSAKMEMVLKSLLERKSTNESIESWKEENWLPSKMNQAAVTHFMKILLGKTESEQELGLQFLKQLASEGFINKSHMKEGLGKVLSTSLLELEVKNQSTKSSLAQIFTLTIAQSILSFEEVADLTEGAKKFPIFLLVLQNLTNQIGKDKLKASFDAATSIKMSSYVPKDCNHSDALASILEEYQLSHLMPMLGVQKDISKQLASNPDPPTFLEWLNQNIDPNFFNQTSFVTVLFSTLMRHIVSHSTYPNGDISVQPNKSQTEAEQELLAKFQPVFQPFVLNKPELQLAGVYALQVFCHEMGFPKGLLLRSFVNFYELDIMDEQTYLKWKEDVNDSLPGKGKALFQVNQWLTWLEEAESEEESENDE